MPVLSAAQLAYIRSIKQPSNYTDVLNLYRAPAVSGNKRTGAVLLVGGIMCRRWPASRAPQIVAKIPDVAGARVDELIFFPDSGPAVQRGDELRDNATGQRLKVEGVGVWQTTYAVAASLVQP